jgi:shikimate kinase
MNLFLIGYRCTGKTTVGKVIAATIDWDFVDADILLVKHYGKSIKDIIDTDGWEIFRHMEQAILMQICAADRQVVATGGGVVLDPENIRLMKESGRIFWLGASVQTIRKRMSEDETSGDFRPALTDRGPIEEIEEMLLKRNPYYQDACDFFVSTDGIAVAEITNKIMDTLNMNVSNKFCS